MKLFTKFSIILVVMSMALLIGSTSQASKIVQTTEIIQPTLSGANVNWNSNFNDWIYTKADENGVYQIYMQRLTNTPGILEEIQLTDSAFNKYAPKWGYQTEPPVYVHPNINVGPEKTCVQGFTFYYLGDSTGTGEKELYLGCVEKIITTNPTKHMQDIPITFPGDYDVNQFDNSQDQRLGLDKVSDNAAYLIFTTTDGIMHSVLHHESKLIKNESGIETYLFYDFDYTVVKSSNFSWPDYVDFQEQASRIYSFPRLGGKNRNHITFLVKENEDADNQVGVTRLEGNLDYIPQNDPVFDVILTNLPYNLANPQFGPMTKEHLFFETSETDNEVGQIIHMNLIWAERSSGSYTAVLPRWCDMAHVISDDKYTRWQLRLAKPAAAKTLQLRERVQNLDPQTLKLVLLQSTGVVDFPIEALAREVTAEVTKGTASGLSSATFNLTPTIHVASRPITYIATYARTQDDRKNDIYISKFTTPMCGEKSYTNTPVEQLVEDQSTVQLSEFEDYEQTSLRTAFFQEIQLTCLGDNLFPNFLHVYMDKNFSLSSSTKGFYSVLARNERSDGAGFFHEVLIDTDVDIKVAAQQDKSICTTCYENFDGSPVEDNNNYEDDDGKADWCENPGCTPDVLLGDPTGDYDNDGVLNEDDCCPCTYNPTQYFGDDGDDVCDPYTIDGHYEDGCDNCPTVENWADQNNNGDVDADGNDIIDNLDGDTRQADSNHDGIGDACEEVETPDDNPSKSPDIEDAIPASYNAFGGACNCSLQPISFSVYHLRLLIMLFTMFMPVVVLRFKK